MRTRFFNLLGVLIIASSFILTQNLFISEAAEGSSNHKYIEFFNEIIMQKKNSKAKDDNKEYKKLNDKEILEKLYNNITEQRNDIHKNIILIIASMLIIISS